MEEIGEVVVNNGKSAIVRIERYSACSKCKKKCELAEDHESGEMLVEVDNPVGAVEGQQISLKMEGKNLVFSALLIYLFPLFSMILGYFTGTYLMPLENEFSGIIGALSCLGIAFLIIKLVSTRTAIQPKITRVVSNPTDNNNNFSCH
ncbi:hypothetical protein U472_10065 [Orenia metallireducens]|uniref:Positive regulator of sigma(E), RseC/MucC n=1 Tax=Orenia metallireducens TaxID=1413210 RepID=A0A1C0A7W1_9FIRM|nr:SoxR reducing system RseC family protein [Orenia metallireducens]OCL26343.1 hypothetical protein U472_10065 [Orenia metallireducens]